MLFISRDKSPSYVMVHGLREEYASGALKKLIYPGIVAFSRLEQPFEVSYLPVKKGVAQGKLRTEEAAKALRKAGHTFLDEEGEDVTEFRIIDFLFGHDDYGVEYVAVGTSTGQEILPKDRFLIEQSPDSGFSHYCRLCKQSFKNIQGAEGHVSSNKHQELFKEAEKVAWDQMK